MGLRKVFTPSGNRGTENYFLKFILPSDVFIDNESPITIDDFTAENNYFDLLRKRYMMEINKTAL